VLGVEKATIVRLRGHVSLSQSVGTALDGFRGAIGYAQATPEAFAAGTGSLRSPLLDADWDGWMWHTFFDIRTPGATIGGEGSVWRQAVDSKAMRKVQAGDTSFVIVETVETGTASVRFEFDSRELLKLS
jgi:hypothetical protein